MAIPGGFGDERDGPPPPALPGGAGPFRRAAGRKQPRLLRRSAVDLPELVRVVIADDHRLFADAVRFYLEHRDGVLVVGTAYNGRDAIKLVVDRDADVLLLDLHMQDGGLIIERLRTAQPGMRVIAMSGLPHVGDEAHAAGAAAFLCKQDIRAHLLDTIHTVAVTPRPEPSSDARPDSLTPASLELRRRHE